MSLFPRHLPPTLRGLLIAAAGMVIISPDGVMLHMLTQTPLMDTVFWRCLGTGISLLLILAVVYRRRLPALVWGMGWIGIWAVVFMSLSNLFFVDAMAHTSVANTLVFMASMPLWSAVLGLIFLRERVHAATWVSIGLGLIGIVIIMAHSLTLGQSGLRGDLSALAAALSYALNLVVLRRAGDRDMTATLMVAGFATAAVCAPFLQGGNIPLPDGIILAVAGLGILPAGMALFMAGARTAPAAEVALLALVETLLGPVWAWLVLSEAPGLSTVIGGILILIAVALPPLRAITRRPASPRDPESL